MEKVLRSLASLKLAVITIVTLTISLAVATTLESLYDTHTAQFWVYHAWWFKGLLTLLAINILAVMVDRIPWKPRHTPFLLAHIGILMLLAGSLLTQKIGLDGTMSISEGQTSSVVELDHNELLVQDTDTGRRVSIPWIPSNIKFKPMHLTDYGIPYDLTVDRYITHADPIYNFISDKGDVLASPAVEVQIKGGLMAIQQDYWLWGGDPTWTTVQAGPASLMLDTVKGKKLTAPKGHPSLIIIPEKNGGLRYIATSSEGRKVSGFLSSKEVAGHVVDPGWHGDVKLIFKKWVPEGLPQTTYKPSRMTYGKMAPPSAIHLVSEKGGPGNELWLGLGERAVLEVGKKHVELGYSPERVVLPFEVRLEHFQINHYNGTDNPSSYSSKVTVFDDKGEHPDLIRMNHPMHFKGITLYQASYVDALPRPTTSVLSVNRDPGRLWKYLGSILIVLGSILLFAMKYVKKRKPPQSGTSAAAGAGPTPTGSPKGAET